MIFIGSVLTFLKFGGQTFKNVHEVRKLAFRPSSVSLYVGLVFMCKVSIVDPSSLRDILRVKMYGYDSSGTT